MSFRTLLRRTAARIVGSDDVAEDILQDAFCRLWTRHHGLNDSGEAIRLSYVAVRNSAIDTLRRSGRCLSVPVENLAIPCEVEDSEDFENIYQSVIELSRKVLTDRQYEVFRLHDIEGVDYAGVAEQLGLSNENVRTILSRARKAIREVYRNTKID